MSSVLSRFSGSYASTSRIDNRRGLNNNSNHAYLTNGDDAPPSDAVLLKRRRQRCGMIITTVFVIGVIIALSLTIVHIYQAPSAGDAQPTIPPIGAGTRRPISSPTSVVSPPTSTTIRPTAAPTVPGFQACNGYEHLCDIAVNEIFYATLHNAVSSIEDGVTIVPNHELSLEKALDAGYRGINFDIGKCNDFVSTQPIRLVHGLCSLGTRDPIEVFTNIQTFLQEKVNEVIVIPIQIDNALDGGAISSYNEIYSIMEQVPGFVNLLYQHSGFGNPWPTLRELIANNTRIITFFYNGATLCVDDPNGCPLGFHDWFTYAAETEFQFDTVDDILSQTDISCSITRGGQGLRNFFGINYFTRIPSATTCQELHTFTNIETHIETCTSINANIPAVPNMLIVDYWNIGDVLDVVAQYNEQLANNTVTRSRNRQLLSENVTLNMIGSFDSVMNKTEQEMFLLSCSEFYHNTIQQQPEVTVTNVYCSDVVYQTLLLPEQRQRYLQPQEKADPSILQVTVLVRGDAYADSSQDNTTALILSLEAPVLAETSSLVQSLSNRSKYFFQVKNITISIQNDTTTIVADDTLPNSSVPSTPLSIIPTSTQVPSTSSVPTLVPVALPLNTNVPVSNAPSISPTKGPATAGTDNTTDSNNTSSLVCNGHVNLCDRRVDDILFATIHNGASTLEDGVVLFPNHDLSFEKALVAGYRGINLDIGRCSNTLRLVHGFCFLGYREIIPTFGSIVSFLQQNTNEVIIIPIEVDNDIGGTVTLQEIDTMLQQVPGMKELMYHHPITASQWPTLRELIAANTRILFFVYNYGENCYSTNSCPLGINDWFQYAGESEFQFNVPDQIINDKQYSCAITRGSNNAVDFYGVNVFTRVPQPDNCRILHTKENLLAHLSNCSSITGQSVVNLLIVDCWDIGDVLTVVDIYNAGL